MTITKLNISEGTVGRKCMPNVQKRYVAIIVVLILAVLLALVIAYCLGAFTKSECVGLCPPNPIKSLPPSASKLRIFRKAAVCADGPPCAQIGREILLRNGSAVDATLAVMFCNGVYTMQSMGLGGGFFMIVYSRENQAAYALNAREKAPSNISEEMFREHPEKIQEGPLAVGVPGELRGYWEAHKKFGKLPWEELIQPTIELCDQGIQISNHQFTSLGNNKNVKNDTNLREWFINEDGSFKKAGTKYVPQKLCETLKIIAKNGGDDLYNGTLSKMLLDDLKEVGSVISAEDLASYQPEWVKPVSVSFNKGDVLYSMPPPGSGVILSFILSILDGYNMTKDSIDGVENTVQTMQRMVEAFKYAFARRTELGDPNFVDLSGLVRNLTSPEYAEAIRREINESKTSEDAEHYGAVFYNTGDGGTAHISVLAENGDAVSVTSSVNIFFGAGFTSKQTGVLMNSGMDDFSLPFTKNYFGLRGSPNNRIAPGKRSLSSMSPSIVTDKDGEVRIVIGASGGTKITTAVAQVIARVLWFGQNIKEAVDQPRIHHQLYPMKVEYEYGLLQQYVAGLESKGHNMTRYTNAGSIICALFKMGQLIYSNADVRKGGDVYGID